MSDKRAGWLSQYAAEKKRRGVNQVCAVTGKPITMGIDGEWHHTRGRRTLEALLTFIPVSSEAHRWIHANSSEAMRLGFLQPEYRKSSK